MTDWTALTHSSDTKTIKLYNVIQSTEGIGANDLPQVKAPHPKNNQMNGLSIFGSNECTIYCSRGSCWHIVGCFEQDRRCVSVIFINVRLCGNETTDAQFLKGSFETATRPRRWDKFIIHPEIRDLVVTFIEWYLRQTCEDGF